MVNIRMDNNKDHIKKTQIPLFEPDSIEDYGEASFVISSCNHEIFPLLENWLNSDETMLLIVGEKGSGKSHLAHILCTRLADRDGQEKVNYVYGVSEATACVDKVVGARSTDIKNDLCDGGQTLNDTLIVDDVTGEDMSSSPRAILDLIENCRTGFIQLVLVGRGNPIDWAQDLKDLNTRLEAMARITMMQPDEDLMRAIIGRHLQARQLALPMQDVHSIANYAAPRLSRTFVAAHDFCKKLDLLALSEKKKPSKTLARAIIEQM